MLRSVTRSLPILVVSGALVTVAAAPAQAFTAPLGSDKGSIVVTKDTDASSPTFVRDSADRSQGY
jgi:hypothetical protein